MEEQQQQQQQHPPPPPPQIPCSVVECIARLSPPPYCIYRGVTRRLFVDGDNMPPIDRRSLQHLVDFLDKVRVDGDSSDPDDVVRITELELHHVRLMDPSDGGLDLLCTFFARSDTTITKVTLQRCKFGSQQDTSRLFNSLSHQPNSD
jgi:hypothetical protein